MYKDARDQVGNRKGRLEKLEFILLKLPGIYLLILLGFIMEFLVELPFMVLCKLDQLRADIPKRRLHRCNRIPKKPTI